jgi:nicotinamide phosphoribosyltransferase
MSSHESGALSGAGHLLSFKGTDTIPAIEFLEEYYGADVTKELVGCSVPATEHSIMCMGTQESEIKTFERLLDLYPEGILSVVSDTWNLWTVCTDFLPKMKDKIMGRNGKLVIRPDSGDPVDIICGAVNWTKHSGLYDSTQMSDWRKKMIPEDKGVIELLWDVFGGTVNELGYKVLDPHIGAIYGDSITLDRAEQICERLKAKGFASTNVVLGIGSYTYQYNTRDTFGFAIKATYGEVRTVGSHGLSNPIGREIFKDPITDDGTKKSAKGLLCVKEVIENNNKTYELKDQVSNEEEKTGALKTVFKDGILLVDHSLQEIRERLAK